MQPMERFQSAEENSREASQPPLPINSFHNPHSKHIRFG
jgi:hypothetical protein